MKDPLSATILSALCALPLMLGCSKRAAPEFVKAEITLRPSAPNDHPTTNTITDLQQVKSLAGFFPGFGEGRSSTIAGGWIPTGIIQFFHPDGESVTVEFGLDFKLWTEGRGDWSLPAEFQPFLLELIKEQENGAGPP